MDRPPVHLEEHLQPVRLRDLQRLDDAETLVSVRRQIAGGQKGGREVSAHRGILLDRALVDVPVVL